MNTSSIDALADVALRQQGRASLSPPSFLNHPSDASNLMAAAAGADPRLIAAMSSARRISTSSLPLLSPPSMPSMTPMISMAPMTSMAPMNQALSSGSTDHAIYLSILNEQRRRSLTDINSTRIAASASMPTPMAAPSASTVGVSAASNFASMMQTQFDSTVTAPSRRRKPNFAEKLHNVLNSKDCRHAIAWLPSGRSFCITDQDEFVKTILPKFFRVAKFESFSRRLKRWGFRKVYTTGLSQVIFSHDLFHRDRLDLCKIMNGREKMGANDQDSCEGAGAAPFAQPQQDQFHTAMMLQQAQAQVQQTQQFHQPMAMQPMNPRRAMLAAAVQKDPSVPVSAGNFLSSSIHSLRVASSSPESNVGIDAQAMLNEANAIASRSMPQVATTNQVIVNANDPSTIHMAKQHLTRLNSDIANCEEQLNILQQLKDLKEKRRMLVGASINRRVVSRTSLS